MKNLPNKFLNKLKKKVHLQLDKTIKKVQRLMRNNDKTMIMMTVMTMMMMMTTTTTKTTDDNG